MDALLPAALRQRLDAYSLPKWPQMLVWGDAIRPEQAQDIILRTDEFLTNVSPYSFGNNRDWCLATQATLGFSDYFSPEYDPHFQSELTARLRAAVGFLETEYLVNHWANSLHAHGVSGWSHPDGTVWFSGNIGRYPTAEEVAEEWARTAAAFPFLSLTVTLMSQSQYEDDRHPVFSLRVKAGGVTLLDTPVMPDSGPGTPPPLLLPRQLAAEIMRDPGRGCAIPDDWLPLYAERLKPLLAALGEQLRRERGRR